MIKTLHKGFSVIELLVTLFVAVGFLYAGYQLYTVVIIDSNLTRSEVKASNLAIDYMKQYASLINGTCTVYSPLTNSVIAVTGLSNVTMSVDITCPYSTQPTLSEVTATIKYNDPQKKLVVATYVDRNNLISSGINDNCSSSGTVSYAGSYKIHTFKNVTASDSFSSSCNLNVEYLVVAGGGGGGGRHGGGGAGGVLTGMTQVSSGQGYSVVVGSGGAGGASATLGIGTQGSNSSFSNIIAIGGGGGGGSGQTSIQRGTSGGSGGGATGDGWTNGTVITGSNGTAYQGNKGGDGYEYPSNNGGGGGGGAGAAGSNSSGQNQAGAGGIGFQSYITGSAVYYGGGGGGTGQAGAIADGGLGGGGKRGVNSGNGTANTGGGGGAGGDVTAGGTGGSGIVVVRYDLNKAYSPPITCPSGFIIVPGSKTYGTNDFCVMKYEAKQVSATVPISQANGTPWVSISQTNASAYSQNVAGCIGCHLITEAEWLTVAQNVLTVPSNWSSGSVGSGSIYSGHNDNSPANSLAASSDSDGYSGTGNTSGNQKRTLTLTNGEVVWDFAGNVWEWTSGQKTGSQPSGAGFSYREWPSVSGGTFTTSPYPDTAGLLGSSSWNSSKGIGQIYSDSNDNTLRGFFRSGGWGGNSVSGVLTLYLGSAPSYSDGISGFRVAK